MLDKYSKFARKQLAVIQVHGSRAAFQRLWQLNDDANINLVLGFIITAIIMAIGVVILSNVESAVPSLEDSPWSELQASVTSTTQSGYGLLAIVLIIMAAAGILGVLFMFQPMRKE